MTNTLTSITTLSVVLFALLAYGFIGAQWTAAPSAPPAGNVASPITTSGSTQIKTGNLGVNRLAANSSVWSDEYCDGDGGNCTSVLGGSVYACSDDALLVNGNHTCGECRALGGEIESDRQGNYMCRLYRSSCPSGWRQLQNWRTTTTATCNVHGQCGPCTAHGRPWSNAGIATCTYFYETGDGNCTNWGSNNCSAQVVEVGCY